MRIAMLSQLWFSVPPAGYGPIGRIVADVTEALVALGHDVVLMAPGDSRTSARLVPTAPQPVPFIPDPEDREAAANEASSRAYRAALAAGVDVIHDHTEFPHGVSYPIPIVRTMHGPARADLVCKYIAMSYMGDSFVAISARQRDLYYDKLQELCGPEERLNIVGVVHHPIDVSTMPFQAQKEDFLLFLGRCDWEKNPDGAIRAARAAGRRLVMALRVAPYERDYFDRAVQPLLGPDVTLLGEITEQERNDLMARAAAVLFPSQWEEPFGLVMTEAMACGTPVLALRRGSAPEVIVHGETGFLCENEEEMGAFLNHLNEIDPQRCRGHVETHFSPEVAARKYLDIYEQALSGAPLAPPRG